MSSSSVGWKRKPGGKFVSLLSKCRKNGSINSHQLLRVELSVCERERERERERRVLERRMRREGERRVIL